MPKRSVSTLVLLATIAMGSYYAYEASQLYIYRAVFAGSYTYNLLFTSINWLIPLAAFFGIFIAATSQSQTPEMLQGKILRHNELAFLVHWAHALSTLMLLGTGIYLGFLFIPRSAMTTQMVGFALNLHFLGVVIFCFSISAHLADLYLTGKLREHWPQASDLRDAFLHYTSKIGLGKKPAEGKYLASEKLSYPLWVLSVGLILVTGLIKVAAHIWSLSGNLLGLVTLLHDVGALLVMVNLAIHVLLSSIVPWSWPLFKSMLTGYVSEEYVQKYHVKWYQELVKGSPRNPS